MCLNSSSHPQIVMVSHNTEFTRIYHLWKMTFVTVTDQEQADQEVFNTQEVTGLKVRQT